RAAAPAGIPADLLFQRPDVLAAGHRLDAAGYSIEARRAELRPSLSLSGSIGLQSTQITGLFNVHQWFTNLAANLLEPVFDGGRRQTQVALAEARFNQLAAAYGRTVVTAVNEVEAALAGLESEGRRHEFLMSRQEEAQATLDLRSERYASGIGGYADFLDALRALLNVESALTGSRRDLALARLAVHRALGGAWVASEQTQQRTEN
ncbi:MAG: TolC family protein, partial [Rhodospirillales bacterium]|nr:TolC family protein [Rhodospirillales bacterium]